MNVLRITSPEEVIKFWPIFCEGLKSIKAFSGETSTDSNYCKMLINFAARTNDAWLGVAIQGGPLSYGLAVDSTPPFADNRTFSVCSFYHVPGQHDATFALMSAFEVWARDNNVASYVVTTRRQSGPAIRCFSSGRYGFKKSYRAFEKPLT